MTAFWAIVKLSLRNALRSHVFQLLLALLVLCAVLLPVTVSGGGEGAQVYIQIALKYSLGTIGFFLALSVVWLSSQIMNQDVENYQLHMVVVKPVARWKIFLAKYAGIVLLHWVLLAISGVLVYGLVMLRYEQDRKVTELERMRIRNEVLVGRRVFSPEPPDLDKLAKEAVRKQIAELEKSGRGFRAAAAADLEKEILKGVSKELLKERAEIGHREFGEWTFRDLPKEGDAPLYLRYRTYVGKVDSQNQRFTDGLWIGYFVRRRPAADGAAGGAAAEEDWLKNWEALTPGIDREYAGEFHEKALRHDLVMPDGRVALRYLNVDQGGSKVYFQAVDGPRLLLRITGFGGNFCRGILVMALMILVYTGITCAAASAFSAPTAIFTVFSYVFLGSVTPLVLTTAMLKDVTEYSAYYIGKLVMLLIVPLQEFEISGQIAAGELIEFGQIGDLLLTYFVLRALPLILLGMWLYRRRELGLVIRK